MGLACDASAEALHIRELAILNLLSHYRGKHLYRSSKILCALSHQELTAGVIGLCVFADISQSD